MKILVISSTPWSQNNSFGNTFSNLFCGMEGVEIYNICCKHGESSNTVVKKSFQMTDKSVLKSIYKGKRASGWTVKSTAPVSADNTEISEKARNARRTVSFIIRDMVWKMGRWRKNPELMSLLEEVAPDVVYLPIYAANHMCDVQSHLIKRLGVPVVGHISDDVYGYVPKASLLARFYKMQMRKKLRRLIDRCAYLEVFAENMADEYSRTFNKTCYLIGKGVDPSQIKRGEYTSQDGQTLVFCYTGNIGAERYEALCAIGRALDAHVDIRPAVLDIYSATPLDERMRDRFDECKSIRFHGAISRDEVDRVQDEADVLVHVESFSPVAIHSARMSFSTKIIDYMMAGKPIFAAGPEEVNSISVLKKHGAAVIAASDSEIDEKIKALLGGELDMNKILANAYEYLLTERDIKAIQKGIKERLDELVQEKLR